MTTQPTRPAKKLPKGRVLWQLPKYADGIPEYCKFPFVCSGTVPVAVLPCRTAKEARAWVRLHGMSREKLIECVAREFMRANWVAFNKQQDGRSVTARDHDNTESAIMVLRAIGLISQ